jgi:2-keto-4-pentenoate hydratase
LSESERERVARGLRAQLGMLAESRAAGEQLVGWKVGLNSAPVQRHLGISRPVIGHLTTGSLIEPGSTHSIADGVRVGVEPEVAIRLGRAGAIESLGPAIEVVDLDPALTELEPILAANVFHRGVLLGPPAGGFDRTRLSSLEATVRRNGSVAAQARFADADEAPEDVVKLIADRLALVGDEPREGQVIIAGSLTEIVFVEPGDAIEVDLGEIGALALGLA